MKRGNIALAALGMLLLSNTACVDDSDSPSLIIIGNKALSASCVAEANETGQFVGRGVLDMVFPNPNYHFNALVRNQMPDSNIANRRDVTDGRVDVNGVRLERAEVDYEFPDPQLNPGRNFQTETVRISGSVDSDSSLAAISIPLLNDDVVTALLDALPDRNEADPYPDGTMIARVQLFGSTRDGAEVRSDAIEFPIDVCKGCLLLFPPEAAAPGPPNCRRTDGPTANLTVPCLLGQDERVDCRICRQQLPIQERDQSCEPL